MYLQDRSSFVQLVERLQGERRFALDTEFLRETTFRPRLCLLQIAVGTDAYAVDPLAVGDLTPFLELIQDPGIEKIVHAGEQDMEIFFVLGGSPPRNVMDTQIAAALAGHGDRLSYGRLVEAICGVRLVKRETFTDWSRRPLSGKQVEYALNDVRYLLPMVDSLGKSLRDLGRIDWLHEESRFYENRSTYEKEGGDLLRKVKGWSKLSPRELGILRELALWREREAEARDRTRGRILSDEPLLQIARSKPSNVEALGGIRGVHPQLVRRSGRPIVECVARGLKIEASDCPQPEDRSWETPEVGTIVDLLDVILRARAAECRIAPSYLGSRREILQLVASELGLGPSIDGNARERPRILTGWRKEMVGTYLLEFLEGNRRVGIRREPLGVEVVDASGVGSECR